MGNDAILTPEQVVWKIRAARVLNIPLSSAEESHADAYGKKTAAQLGPDALGATNPTRAIDSAAFQRNAEVLQAAGKAFLADWDANVAKVGEKTVALKAE